MTTEQYWANLDALASSKGTDRLLDAAELLRANPSLPLLISCRRAHGRIQHLFTSFDERNLDATGNAGEYAVSSKLDGVHMDDENQRLLGDAVADVVRRMLK